MVWIFGVIADIIIASILMIGGLLILYWLCVKIGEQAEEKANRMTMLECKYGHRGFWADCGDGTIMYIVDGKPIIDSLEMK